MNSFNELLLPAELQKALHKIGFETPTPIQQQAIPVALEGGDILGTAQTGTGKTAAFSIPIFVDLLKNPGRTALIITPTRELAVQIDAFWRQLTQFCPQLRTACLIGGQAYAFQSRALSRGPRVLIGTPGRLADHINRRNIRLARSELLVLDEADRMFDMGFKPQLMAILRTLPQKRQSMLFSATWDTQLDQFAKSVVKNPTRIAVGETGKAATTVEQIALATTSAGKNETLLRELSSSNAGSVLVFARTKSRTDRLARFLDSKGLRVGRLHGGRSQSQRNTALDSFRKGQTRILVATDLVARGIDVSQVSRVINFDLPRCAEDYVHRIGRTGRAGNTGQAISLITPEDRYEWKAITKLLKKTGSKAPVELQG